MYCSVGTYNPFNKQLHQLCQCHFPFLASSENSSGASGGLASSRRRRLDASKEESRMSLSIIGNEKSRIFFFHLREKCPRGRGFAPELARVVIETTPKQGRKSTLWGIFFRGNEKRREKSEGMRYRRKEITKVCI